jgi:predicted dehydrogenase
MRQVNIALIGTGYIADYHIRGLLSLRNVHISAIADIKADAASQFADKYKLSSITTSDVHDIFRMKDTDAVVIATPNKFHFPYAMECLKKGKDIFIEKPMAMDHNEAQKIITLAESAGRLVMVGHMWRFDEEVIHIRDVVHAGKIGEIVKTKGYGIHENWGPSGWFTRRDLAGGGALIDMGVHAIDTVRFLLGDPKASSVYARIGTHYGKYDVDDTGILIINWENGTSSVIESGWWQPHTDGPEAATRLFGTNGYASVFPTFIQTGEGHREDFIPEGPPKSEHCDQQIYTRQMAHFAESIVTRVSHFPGMYEGLEVMRIVDAAFRSAAGNKVIKMNT